MKGLNIEDKDSLKEYLIDSLYTSKTLPCPSYKRSFIPTQNPNPKSSKSNKNKKVTINIISHLNNLNSSKLSESSPIKKKFSPKNKSNQTETKFNLIQNFFKFPEIKEFKLYYEIPFHGKYDFVFLLRGNMEKTDWTKKTSKIRTFPRHLKNTLFYQDNDKFKKIHLLNLKKIYQIYSKIKNGGLILYNNRKFRECLEQFNYAYGLFKWIEFKDKNIKLNEVIKKNNFTILDSDIDEKRIIINSNNNKLEEMYKACLIYILEIMAYCNIELRLFSHAIECLEECAILAQNNFPDVYLRCAQARIYNKKSTDEELKLAEKDINKAINIVNKNNNKNKIDRGIYYRTKNKLNQIIKKRLETKVKYIKALLKRNLNLKNKNKNLNNSNDNVLYIKIDDNKRQYKILKEIKKKYVLAFKFFTETKNYIQLDLTYKEYESFYDIYNKFKFFYKFNPSKMNEKILHHLNENEKNILFDVNNKTLIEKNKKNICEYIFSNSNYNKELYKYAVDKILEEEKTQNEKDIKSSKIKNEINDKNKKCFVIKTSICSFILIFVSVGLQIFYLKNIRNVGFRSIYK